MDARDLWTHKAIRSLSGLQVNLRAHASAMYKLTTSLQP